ASSFATANLRSEKTIHLGVHLLLEIRAIAVIRGLFEWNGADRIQTQTRLQKDQRTDWQACSKKGQRRVAIRHSKTCCAPVALRFPPGNGRRTEIMGPTKGTSLEARRETSCR